MSRHDVSGRYHHHRIVVGWDQPLMTFFVHVHDTGKTRDENPVVWLGGMPRELYDIEDLERALRPYADLSPTLARILHADRDDGR